MLVSRKNYVMFQNIICLEKSREAANTIKSTLKTLLFLISLGPSIALSPFPSISWQIPSLTIEHGLTVSLHFIEIRVTFIAYLMEYLCRYYLCFLFQVALI